MLALDQAPQGVCSAPILSTVCSAGGGVASSVASDAFSAIAHDFASSFADAVKDVTTFWTQIDTPTLGGANGPVSHIQALTFWLQGAVLVGSLLLVAGRMALSRSGAAATDGLRGLVTSVLVTGCGLAAIDALSHGGDVFSQWVINQSTGGDFGSRLAAIATGDGVSSLGVALMFVLSLLGIVSCIVQIFLLLARVGVITVVAGLLPVTAAASGTASGRQVFNRSVSWVVAFVLYKPIAAIIYASAFTLIGTGSDVVSVLSGFMLIILSIFALPALMRLVTPAVAAATSAGGGGGAAAAGALASGAISVASLRSSGGGSPSAGRAGLVGGGSGSGPSGASSTAAAAGRVPAMAGASASGAGAAGASGAAGAAGAASSAGAAGAAGAAGPAGAAVAAAGQAVGGLKRFAEGAAAGPAGGGEG